MRESPGNNEGVRSGVRWEQHLDQQLMEAAWGDPTFAEDDLTAEEFVDLEVALGDVPTAQPVAGAPLELSLIHI